MRKLMVILLGVCLLSLLLVINCDKRNPSGPQNPQGQVVSSVSLFLPAAFKAPAGTQTVDISAVAKDAYGGGIEGVVLNFQLPTSSNGFISKRDSETDQDGIIRARYTVNLQSTSIEDTITAVVEGSEVKDVKLLRINLLNQVIDSMALTVDNPVKVIGDSSSITNTLRATVVDTNNVGISGLLVTFSANYGSISNVDTTDLNGTVSAVITVRKQEIPVNQNAISPSVFARIGGKVDSAQFTVMRQTITPSFLTLSASPYQIKLARGDRGTSTVSAEVKDSNGNAVAGWQVSMWTDAIHGTIITPQPTNASGETSTTYRSAVMSDTAINATVVGSVTGVGGVTIRDTAYINLSPLDEDIDSISVWADSSELTVPAGGSASTTVRARVVDVNNVVIPNLQVSFSATIGALGRPTLTDSNGVAAVNFATNGDTGRAVITARAGDKTGSAIITINQSGIFTGSPPNEIDITASPRSMTLATGDEGTSTITMYVKDVNGNGVGGVQVNLVTEHGSIAKPPVTDAAGMTTTTLRSTAILPGNHGTRVTANITYVTSQGPQQIQNSVTVYFLPLDNIIGSINVWADELVVSALPGKSAVDTIYARVVDTTNTAIPNLKVNFSTDHGALSPSALTDSTGKAMVVYFSDGYFGDAIITATVGNNWSDSVRVRVNQVLSTIPDRIDLSAFPRSMVLAVNDEGTSIITMVLKDIYGNGIPDFQLDVMTEHGSISRPSLTDAHGSTQTMLRSVSIPTGDHSTRMTVEASYVDSVGNQRQVQNSILVYYIPLDNAIGFLNVWADTAVISALPGQSATDTIYARVVDTTNTGISDLKVNFRTNHGALSSSSLTDSTGKAMVIYFSDGYFGDATITATVGNWSDSVRVTVNQLLGTTPDRIDISASPRSMVLAANDVGTSTITMVLKNINGIGIPNFQLDIMTEHGSISRPLLTDADGSTQTVLRSFSIPTGDHSTMVTATACYVDSAGNQQQVQNSLTVYFYPLSNVVSSINVWAYQPIITALPGQSVTDTIYARVIDTTNTAIPNLKVNFRTDHGALSPSALTDTSGLAKVIYFSDGYIGDAIITATVGDTWSDTTRITVNLLGSTGSLILMSNRSVIYADGDATHARLRAVLKNSRNEPIAGDSVRFFVDLACAKVSSPRMTDSTGTAHSIFDDIGVGCVTSIETATIIARYDKLNLADTVQVSIAPIPDVARIELTSSASAGMRGNGVDSAYVYARVFLANNDPAPTGTEIHFEANMGNIVPRDTIVQNGTATALLYAPSAIGSGIIIASWKNTVFDTLEVQYRPGRPAYITLVDGISISSLHIGESGRIYVAITDSSNWGVGRNHPVYWSTTLGTIDALSQTDSNGVAYARLNAQTEAGLAQVVVKTSGIQDSLSLGIPIYPDPPNSIEITSNVDQIQVQGTGGSENAILSARVVDVGGNNVLDGFPVRFEVRQPSPDVLFGNGRDTVTVSTSSGEARASLNSGLRSGPVRIRAVTWRDTTTMADSIWSEVTNINVVSGQPYYIDIDASYEPDVSAGAADLFIEVNARVQDVYGNNVVQGTAVFFTVDTTVHNNWHGPFAHIDGSATILDSSGVAVTNMHYNSEATFKYVDVRAMCTTTNGDSIFDVETMRLPLYEGELGLTVFPTSYSFNQGNFVIMHVSARLFDGLMHPINNAKIIFGNDKGLSFCADSTHAANLTFWPPQNYANQTLWRAAQYTGGDPPPLLRQPIPLNQDSGQALMFMRAQLQTQNNYPGVPDIGNGSVTGNVEAHVYDYPSVSADAVTVTFHPPGAARGGNNTFISKDTR